jgi:hypothetical protein
MTKSERFRLLYSYTTPACRIGQRVRCAVFGEVEVVGYSDAPLPWPVCRRGKWRVPIVFRGLETAGFAGRAPNGRPIATGANSPIRGGALVR